jgi:hypothetical protein
MLKRTKWSVVIFPGTILAIAAIATVFTTTVTKDDPIVVMQNAIKASTGREVKIVGSIQTSYDLTLPRAAWDKWQAQCESKRTQPYLAIEDTEDKTFKTYRLCCNGVTSLRPRCQSAP